MAKYTMCSVLDLTAQQYGRPFFTISDGSAIRGFSDEINHPDDNSILYKHPDDFQLFRIGTFDDSTGKVDLCDPVMLVSGASVAVRG